MATRLRAPAIQTQRRNPRNARVRHAAGLTRIRLAGGFGRRFGREHFAAVGSVKEAIDALECRAPGFREEIERRGDAYVYRVQVGRQDLRATVADPKELLRPTRGQTITITPLASGSASNSKGIVQVIAGVALIVVGVIVSFTGLGTAIGVPIALAGFSVLVGGVASLIAGTPKQGGGGNGKPVKGNTRFNGPANLAGQGNPIPLAYGRPWCGVVIVSNDLYSLNVAAEVERNDATITPATVTYADRNGAAFHAVGGGGGGSSADSSAGAKEDKDTAHSRQYSAVLGVLSQGPVDGIEGDLAGVALDGTRMQNPDGTGNFRNWKLDFRSGTQTQAPIDGFDAVSAVFPDSVRIKQNLPYVRHFADTSIDAVRFQILYPELSKTDSKNGNVKGSEVKLAIEVSQNGGAWQTLVDPEGSGRLKDKVKDYTKSFEIRLPQPGPWDVRIRRVTADSNSRFLQNETHVTSRAEITYVKLSHPNVAKLGLQIDSGQFSSIPNLAVLLRGRIVQVPANYDPLTRTRAGVWDGTWKSAWTDNPAWCWHDLVTNTRYGAGQILNGQMPNKWELETCAQYCDQRVPDNHGGTEPRYTLNVWISEQQQALKLIADLASAFRAMIYYRAGRVGVAQDRPSAFVRKHFGPSNVENGSFRYVGTAATARHNLINVEWQDPLNLGQTDFVETEDSESIAQEGRIKLDKVVAFGCYSRGQAWRTGEFHRFTGLLETDTVTFRTGLDGGHLKPGDVFGVANPFRSGSPNQGRVAGGDNTNIVLDREITLGGNGDGDYQIACVFVGTDESGEPNTMVVSRPLVEQSGTVQVVHVAEPFPSAPARQTKWAIVSRLVQEDLFRVVSVAHQGGMLFEVQGLTYNASKYDAIELGTRLTLPPPGLLPDAFVCQPPGPATVREISRTLATGGIQRVLEVTWDPSPDPFLSGYRVLYRVDAAPWQTLHGLTPATTATLPIVSGGEYEFEVFARNSVGATSVPVLASFTSADLPYVDGVEITGLELQGLHNGNESGGPNFSLAWRDNSRQALGPGGLDNLADPGYQASGGTRDPMIEKYEVAAFYAGDDPNAGAKPAWNTFTTVARATFFHDQNAQAFGYPRREVLFGVRGLFQGGTQATPWALLLAKNRQTGALTNAQFIPTGQNMSVVTTAPEDLDREGTALWQLPAPLPISQVAQLPPGRRGPDRNLTALHPVDTTFTYYLAAYDQFGLDEEAVIVGPFTVTNEGIPLEHLTQDFRVTFDIHDEVASGIRDIVNAHPEYNGQTQQWAERTQATFAIVGNNSAAVVRHEEALTSPTGSVARLHETIQAEFRAADVRVKTDTVAEVSADGSLIGQKITTVTGKVNGLRVNVVDALGMEIDAQGNFVRATKLDQLSGSVNGVNGRVTDILNLSVSPSSVFMQRFTNLDGAIGAVDGRVSGVNGRVTDILSLNISPSSVLGQRFTSIDGRLGGNEGSVRDILSLNISPNSVLLSRINSLDFKSGENSGSIQNILSLSLPPSSGLIQRLSRHDQDIGYLNGQINEAGVGILARTNTNAAAAQLHKDTLYGPAGNGGLVANAAVLQTVNGFVSGYRLYNTGTFSAFNIMVNQFAMVGPGNSTVIPFVVTAGEDGDGVPNEFRVGVPLKSQDWAGGGGSYKLSPSGGRPNRINNLRANGTHVFTGTLINAAYNAVQGFIDSTAGAQFKDLYTRNLFYVPERRELPHVYIFNSNYPDGTEIGGGMLKYFSVNNDAYIRLGSSFGGALCYTTDGRTVDDNCPQWGGENIGIGDGISIQILERNFNDVGLPGRGVVSSVRLMTLIKF